MLTLTERPEPWSWSRNFIRYRFATALLGGLAVEVQVRLYIGTADGNVANDKLVTLYSLTPNSTGTCEIYVEDLIDAHLQWQMPAPVAGTITPVASQTASFFTEYREVTILAPNGSWTSDIAGRCRAIKGGLPVDLFNRSLPTNFSVLTYQLAHVARVGVADHFYRTFVKFANQQIMGRNAVIEVQFADGTTQTGTIAFSSTALPVNIFHVPASPAAWGLVLTAGKVPVSYQVRIVENITGGTTATTVLINAAIDHNWYRQVYTMQYHNSLGGLDYMRLLGDYDIETDRTYIDGETILTADFNQPARRGQYQQRGISLQKTFRGDAGYFISPDEQDVALELDFSESAWQLKRLSANSLQWLQLRIMNKPRKLRSRSSKRWNYEVEWQAAFAINAFSSLPYPGTGADTNVYVTAVCGLISGLTVMPYSSNGFSYAQFSWQAGLNSWYYHLEFMEVGPGPFPYTISTYVTNYLMNVDAGKTYKWRVRTVCSLTSFSAWVDGPNFTV